LDRTRFLHPFPKGALAAFCSSADILYLEFSPTEIQVLLQGINKDDNIHQSVSTGTILI
jgi:hypothetical protein